MKKERITTFTDSYIDSEGKLHYFVIAAISTLFTEDNEPSLILDDEDNVVCDAIKGVKLGFSICNPEDTFNEELGKAIAIGRARKNRIPALIATSKGYINSTLIDAFLRQEAEYLKKDPSSYKTNYFRDK